MQNNICIFTIIKNILTQLITQGYYNYPVDHVFYIIKNYLNDMNLQNDHLSDDKYEEYYWKIKNDLLTDVGLMRYVDYENNNNIKFVIFSYKTEIHNSNNDISGGDFVMTHKFYEETFKRFLASFEKSFIKVIYCSLSGNDKCILKINIPSHNIPVGEKKINIKIDEKSYRIKIENKYNENNEIHDSFRKTFITNVETKLMEFMYKYELQLM